MATFLEAFQSTPERFMRISPYTQNQLALLNNLGQMGMGTLQNLPNSPTFQPYEQQARRDFMQQTIPAIAERFSGAGLGSPSLTGQLGAAGANLEGDLAQGRANFDSNNLNQQRQYALQLLNMGLQNQYENIFRPSVKGAGQVGSETLLNLLGQVAPRYINNLYQRNTPNNNSNALNTAAQGAQFGSAFGGPLGAAIGGAGGLGLALLLQYLGRPSTNNL